MARTYSDQISIGTIITGRSAASTNHPPLRKMLSSICVTVGNETPNSS